MSDARTLPTGTVTFLFSDIEGSTRLLTELGDGYASLLDTQSQLMRAAIAANEGVELGTEGDSFFVVFTSARAAVSAAIDAQRRLARESWPEGVRLRVRMGIHTGEARLGGENYVGLDVHRAARIAAAAHGGQVLLSDATQAIVAGSLAEGIALRNLGEHRLKDLPAPERLWQLDVDGLETDFPALSSLITVENRLPAELTSFVGRAEVESVVALVGTSRLVTLTGPGGTGKTRLSIKVAAELAPRYRDGTYFVELDAVSDPDLVPSEIASTLGLTGGSEAPLQRVVNHLRDRQMLLILDNLEQVIDAAGAISQVVKECPEVAVIVTSRIPLRVYGEQEFAVPALAVPPADGRRDAASVGDFEAVRLFVERAGAARPGFALDDENAPVVADIVARLDGLPLAIELAAARLRRLPLDALLGRLDAGLGVLTGGARDVPKRQQTLRATIEWSHDLLDEPDRQLFARFSVMSGGATLDLTEPICGSLDELGRDVFDGLESLCDQSLVFAGVGPGADVRYAMLATIREFASERLSESGRADEIRERHARTYLALAEEAAPHLIGRDGAQWNDRLESEHDNMRAALDWIVTRDQAELGLRMVSALWRFWQVRGHLAEGEERVREVQALPSAAQQEPVLQARAEFAAGGISYWRSDWHEAHRHYTAALDHARAVGDKALLAEALYNAGFSPDVDHDDANERFQHGRPYWEESLALYRELDDRSGVASNLWSLAFAHAASGDIDSAVELAEQSLELSRELGDPFRTGWAAHLVGVGALVLGKTEEGAARLREAFDIFTAAGDKSGMVLLILDVAMLADVTGHADQRWRLTGAKERLRAETGADIVTQYVEFLGWDPRVEPATDEERAWFAEGETLTMADAITLANEVLDEAG